MSVGIIDPRANPNQLNKGVPVGPCEKDVCVYSGKMLWGQGSSFEKDSGKTLWTGLQF